MARHRRPVNVRDDGLPAVLGPLITAGGIELAVLLEVDSGMVLDAWAKGGEAETPDAEALGARHADVVRALLALPGSPPAELALTVDSRHHLVRCVADPAGGRLALAVVVDGHAVGRAAGPSAPAAVARRGPDDRSVDALLGDRPAARSAADRRATTRRRAPGPFGRGSGSVPSPRAAVDGDGRRPANPSWTRAGTRPPLPTTGPAATVPDPRRGPAPPSALPPARSAGW